MWYRFKRILLICPYPRGFRLTFAHLGVLGFKGKHPDACGALAGLLQNVFEIQLQPLATPHAILTE
jgi:hypothetical protein